MPNDGHGVAPGPQPTPERTRPTRSETRARILEAAFAAFGERGIAATSLNEVAAEAGLTKGAVYSSFASKDELVLALMEERVMHRLTAVMTSVSSTIDAQLIIENISEVLVDEIHADAAWHRLLAEYFAMSHRDHRLHDALRLRRREARDAVARALVQVARLLDFELPLPVDEMVVVLFALSNGIAIETGIDPEGVPDHLLGSVLALIAPDAITRMGQPVPTPAADREAP